MEAFPFTDEEWDPLKELASLILNASIRVEDPVLAASLRLDMLDRLEVLRERHGDHPVLLETMADYTDHLPEQVALYRRAAQLAEAHHLPTLSIRLSFVFALIELDQPMAALEELRACGDEAAKGNENDQKGWLNQLEMVIYEGKWDILYQRAAEIARMFALPVLRIRLLYVRFQLNENNPSAAREELRRCKSEVSENNAEEWAWWVELCDEANQAQSDEPDPTL